MEKITKSMEVVNLIREEKYKEAMRIAKDFKFELNKEQRNIISRGYESYTNPRFYQSLGQNIEENIRKAIDVLLEVYKEDI